MIKNLIIIATGIISLFYSCQKETYTIDKENDIKEKISIQNGSITSLSEFALKSGIYNITAEKKIRYHNLHY